VPPVQRPRSAEHLSLLAEGELELLGRMPWSSNNTFLVETCLAGRTGRAVYKPGRGERPLWDFPPNLYRRELAAYLLAEALGWGIVPETIVRDGPLGEGSVQRFVDADFSEHYFTLLEEPQHLDALRRIGVFDLLANNADRKGGHCLLAEDQVWAIDHGLCFHADPKLRTVIWDFGGQRIADPLLDDVTVFVESPPLELLAVLDDDEAEALLARARRVLKRPTFPDVGSGRPYPWPLV
jgi:uncharacterized repeat protein (TIGR03843 family)